jgi:hypothetical protein
MSRSYTAQIDEGERICLMVPMHDMANHGRPNLSFSHVTVRACAPDQSES